MRMEFTFTDTEPVVDIKTGSPLTEAQLRAEQRRVTNRASWHIIPLVWAVSFVSFISRTNLVNMHYELVEDLKLSEYQFGVGVGMFYISYVFFQIPSNLILERMQMNTWLALLLMVWGCISMLSVFINSAPSLFAIRFLLGIAEAGFNPCAVYCLTLWFGERYRARKLSLMQSAAPLAVATGGILASLVLDHMNGVLGLKGYRWLFLFTGIPAVFLSVVIYFCLPSSPHTAKFLSDRERKLLLYERAFTASVWTVSQHTSPSLFWSTISSPRNWVISICAMFFVGTIIGISGFTPALMYEMGSPIYVSDFLIAVPNLVSVVALLANSYHSDRKRERFWHIIIPMFLALVALATCSVFVYLIDLTAVIILLSVYQSSIFAGLSVLVAYMSSSSVGSTSVAISLYYSVAAFGGWFGPFLMGLSRDTTGDHVLSMTLMCGSIAIGISLFALLHAFTKNTRTLQVSPPGSKIMETRSTSVTTKTESIPSTSEEEEHEKPTSGGVILV